MDEAAADFAFFLAALEVDHLIAPDVSADLDDGVDANHRGAMNDRKSNTVSEGVAALVPPVKGRVERGGGREMCDWDAADMTLYPQVLGSSPGR